MSDRTSIEWTDATLNIINGCDIVSPGCTNCYAMRAGARRLPNHPSTGLTKPTKAGHVWTGEVRFNEKALLQPLKWKRPRMIFWNAHGDMFHPKVPDEWIDRCFAVMALTPQHIHQVLTKRPDRMRAYLSAARAHPVGLEALGLTIEVMRANPRSQVGKGCVLQGDIAHLKKWPLPNVWLGVSVEDQQRADERIPALLDTPAAVRWLSCEPLLGPVDLTCLTISGDAETDCLNPWTWEQEVDNWRDTTPEWREDFEEWHGHVPGARNGKVHPTIDWVVAGGESGPGARPMHPAWARSLRDQCAEAGVAFNFKQWGAWAPIGKLQDPAGDTDETIAAETAMMDAMHSLPDGNLWIDPRRLQLIDRGMFNWANEEAQPPGDAVVIKNIGKKAAGRLLDGVLHDGFPG